MLDQVAYQVSYEYPLHLVEAHLVAAAVVKLRCARGGVVRHLRGSFERSAVLEVSGTKGLDNNGGQEPGART